MACHFHHPPSFGRGGLCVLTQAISSISYTAKIRNKSIAHNQGNLPKGEVYKKNPIIADELCCFIDETCEVINHLAQEFGLSMMFTSDRVKQSTLKVLSALKAAEATPQTRSERYQTI